MSLVKSDCSTRFTSYRSCIIYTLTIKLIIQMKKIIIKNRNDDVSSKTSSKREKEEERGNIRIAKSSDTPIWLESFNSIVSNINSEVMEKTAVDETTVTNRNLQLEYANINIENRFKSGNFR